MENFFSEDGTFDLGVLIVDARHKPTEDDVRMAEFFQESGHDYLVVANKLDKLKKNETASALELIRKTLALDKENQLIPFSSVKGDGRDELLSQLLHLI